MLPEATVITQATFSATSMFISTVLVYLGLSETAFFAFSLLLTIDYTTGLLKARAIKEKITSNKMKHGIISKLSLILIPIVLAIGAKALGTDFKDVLLVGMNILILSEVYSIISNIYAIRTHEELPEYDVVALLGKKLRTVLLRLSEEKPNA